jgi:uncharacterized protein
MKNKLLLTLIGSLTILILTACSAPISAAPAAELPTQQRGTMTVQGTGEVFLVPDIAYISIGVESRAEQVNEALNANNAQAEQIASALREMGVDERDIQTSAFNVYPMQEYTPMGEFSGLVYVVNNTVNITVRNLQILGEMLDAVVMAGANNIQGIQFDVSDKEEAIKEGRRLAIANARLTAQELADAAGVELGELKNLVVYSNNNPIPVFEGKAYGGLGSAASSVPTAAGQMVLIFNADMTFELK